MYYEFVQSIRNFANAHTLEDTVMCLCNLMLDLVESTDEDFAMEVVGVVQCNDRFDLD